MWSKHFSALELPIIPCFKQLYRKHRILKAVCSIDLERHETENDAHSPFYSSNLAIVTCTVSVNCFCLYAYGHRLKTEADLHCSIEEEEEEE